jgi:hypothetical protein
MTDNKDFEQLILSQVPTTPFKPLAHYDPDGDCIEFIASDESFYAERIDSLVTVYYGRQSKEIVGSLIKGVSKFMREIIKRAPGFRIEIVDGRIKLKHLFTARLWSEEQCDPKAMPAVLYRKLRRVAEEASVEADVGGLALV